MKKGKFLAIAVFAGAVLTQGARASAPAQAGASPSRPIRPIGVVTEIRPGQFTLRTDAGPNLMVDLPEGIAILRVPPGVKDLKSAAKITVNDVSVGDRVLILGPVSADQKSVVATKVIVMSKSALAQAREAEQLDWLRRGIGGVVKAIDPPAKQITIAVPNVPPTAGNPTHPVTLALAANAVLLRYAPGSVKFSDATPAPFEDIKVGDQVRALGDKSADGARFTAEKLVSGTFLNIGATVISVDAAGGTVTVKDLATGKPLVVRTNPDSKLHTLPPFLAMVIARFNAGGATGGMAGHGGGNGSASLPQGAAFRGSSGPGGREGAMGGRAGGEFGGTPRDFNQMLDHAPPLSLSDLKPGEPLIVVSTEGAKASEVTAIAVLAGVESILEARPKGSNEVVLGPWNMSMGGGEEGLQ